RIMRKGISICISIAMFFSSASICKEEARADGVSGLTATEETDATFSDGNGISFTYKVVSGTSVEITKYTGEATEIEIPKTFISDDTTYSIVGIGKKSFYDSKVTSVVLPESVTYILSFAFAYSDLIKIDLPDTIESIESRAFYNSDLSEMSRLPQNLKVIEESVFYSTELKVIPSFPEGLVTIGSSAFGNCDKLTELPELPDGLATIGSSAFGNCDKLTELPELPDGLESIGDRAFCNCNKLTELPELPDGLESIGDWAFYNCKKIKAPSSFPESLTNIGSYAFYGCIGADKLYIGKNLVKIGYCFAPNDNLTEIKVSEENPIYDNRDDCNGIFEKSTYKLVFCCGITEIPEETRIIGSYAFYGDTMTDFEMPDSIEIIEESAFCNCQNLKTITFSKNLLYIGGYCFDGCSSMKELTIPGNVKVIDEYAFCGMSGLRTLVIEEGVISIGGAYSESSERPHSIRSVTLPESLKNILSTDFSYSEIITISRIISGTGAYTSTVTCGAINVPRKSYADWVYSRLKNNDSSNIYDFNLYYNGEANEPTVEYSENDENNYISYLGFERYMNIDIDDSKEHAYRVYGVPDYFDSNCDITVEDESVAVAKYQNGCLVINPISTGITLLHMKSKDALGTEGVAVINVYDSTKDLDAVAINSVIDKIKLIDNEISYPEDCEIIENAGEAYENLSSYQKKKFDSSYLEILENAESEINRLKTEYDNKVSAATEVKNLIDSFIRGGIEFSEECNSKLTEIEEKYSDLDADFKYIVDNYDDFVEARNEYNQLKAKDNQDKADAVSEMIVNLANWDGTLENSDQITDARIAYGSLTDEQKALVSSDSLKMLELYEAKLEKLRQESSVPDETDEPVISEETNVTAVPQTEEPVNTTAVPQTEEPVNTTAVPTKEPIEETSAPTTAPTTAKPSQIDVDIDSLSTASPQGEASSSSSSSNSSATTAPIVIAYYTTANTISDSVDENFEISVKSTVVKNRTYVFAGKYGKAKQVRYVKAAKISWDLQSGVTLYRIYRSETEDGEYNVINETTKNTYSDSKVKYGKKYFYRVQCVKGETTYSSTFASAEIPTTLIKPVLKVKSKAGKFIMLSYKKSEGEFQEVEVLSGKKWIKAKTMCGKISPNKVSRPLNSTKFYVRVRTYTKSNGKKIYSKWSKKIYV
ncbi:MAG: leucine-rich repeat protein, partial [Lachnospiraceae bacterium]|nr:leucine-rich repeat protein [Lachnospiraceae bacterium]